MKKGILLAALTFLSLTAHTADVFNFKSLDVKDGVSDNFIHEILRDKYGFMWFIGGRQLNRYDGYDFKAYELPIPGEHTDYMLKEDCDSNIWVRSNDRFFRYDRRKDCLDGGLANFIPYPGLEDTPLFFDVDHSGHVWFSVREGEVICRRDEKDFRHYALPTGCTLKALEARDGQAFFLLSDGRVFMAGEDAQDTGETRFLTEISLSGQLYQKMYLDTDDILWFYVPHSSTNGLTAFDVKTRAFRETGWSLSFVTSIAEDRRGHLWVGTDNTGIIVYDKQDGTASELVARNENPYSISSNHINCLYLDDQDIMWVGTSKRGISYACLSGTHFEKFDAGGLDDISCMQEDGDGGLWFGTDGDGLIHRRPSGEFRTYRKESGAIPGDLIVCSFTDSRGRVWFGTFGDGVFYHENGRFVRVRHEDAEKNEYLRGVRCIDEDVYGNIWIGSIAFGLFCYAPDGTMTDYTVDNSPLTSNGITDLYCRQGRTLYIATSNGPFVMDTRSQKINLLSTGTDALQLTCIYKDSRGLLWLGGADGLRVLREENGAFAPLTRNNGLSHNYIRGIAEDRNNNMWLTTDVGVTQVIVVDDPVKPLPTFRCSRFYDEDGLHNIMFNLHSLCCLRNGDVLMGGIGGAVRTVPSPKLSVPAGANIVFTALYIANKPVEVGEKVNGRVILPSNIQVCDEITLNYSENSFSIGVSSLNFPVLHKNRLMYRLKGHTDWMALDRNMIHFNRLAPDTYELQLKMADTEATDPETASLKIHIHPPNGSLRRRTPPMRCCSVCWYSSWWSGSGSGRN